MRIRVLFIILRRLADIFYSSYTRKYYIHLDIYVYMTLRSSAPMTD